MGAIMRVVLDPNAWGVIAFIVCLAVIAIVLGMAWIVGFRLYRDKKAFVGLLHEPNSDKASLSRFQFLVFTFVIAGLYLGLSLESGTLIDLPDSALWLLGISGGSYVAAKGVTEMSGGGNQGGAKNAPDTTTPRDAGTPPSTDDSALMRPTHTEEH